MSTKKTMQCIECGQSRPVESFLLSGMHHKRVHTCRSCCSKKAGVTKRRQRAARLAAATRLQNRTTKTPVLEAPKTTLIGHVRPDMQPAFEAIDLLIAEKEKELTLLMQVRALLDKKTS